MPHISKPRPRGTRPKTVSLKSMRADKVVSLDLYREAREDSMPRYRSECRDGPRPCVWARCRYHLYVDVSLTTGSLKLNFPHLDMEAIPSTCALDVADAGATTLEETGRFMNLTRERVRQIEVRARRKVGGAQHGLSLPQMDEGGGTVLRMPGR